MELENVLKLINAVSESSLTSFTLDDGSTKLTFAADRNETAYDRSAADLAISEGSVPSGFKSDASGVERAVSESASSGSRHEVTSPLVGIFYSASSPESENFVSVGDTVKKGQILGIVEAMKLMNEIESDYDGVVKEILVANEQMVEYGQPMFVIE